MYTGITEKQFNTTTQTGRENREENINFKSTRAEDDALTPNSICCRAEVVLCEC
jgi:hypothetical protein